MNNEEFRKLLIYILKNYKIFYLDISGKYEEYYELDKYYKQLESVYKDYNNIIKNMQNDNYRFINSYGKINEYSIEMPNVNYTALLKDKSKTLNELFDMKKINIQEWYSLEEIANELSKIGEKEEFDYIYEGSKLSELKKIMNQNTETKLKYIQDNSNKKIG